MKTIGKTTLQSDENGLVTLQCDRCKSRFKMEGDYLSYELEGEICCPVCGIYESLNTFWPEEVVEKAKKIAIVDISCLQLARKLRILCADKRSLCRRSVRRESTKKRIRRNGYCKEGPREEGRPCEEGEVRFPRSSQNC